MTGGLQPAAWQCNDALSLFPPNPNRVSFRCSNAPLRGVTGSTQMPILSSHFLKRSAPLQQSRPTNACFCPSNLSLATTSAVSCLHIHSFQSARLPDLFLPFLFSLVFDWTKRVALSPHPPTPRWVYPRPAGQCCTSRPSTGKPLSYPLSSTRINARPCPPRKGMSVAGQQVPTHAHYRLTSATSTALHRAAFPVLWFDMPHPAPCQPSPPPPLNGVSRAPIILIRACAQFIAI